jgi:hypothetical protein
MHSSVIFCITARLQIQITVKLGELDCMGLHKFHLVSLGSLSKCFTFLRHPLVAISHLIFLMLQVSARRLKFSDLVSL